MLSFIKISRLSTCIACFALAAWPAILVHAATPEELFGQLDADHDGFVVEKEVSSSHRLVFARLLRIGDGNSDGRLDQAELAAALTPLRPDKPLPEKRGSKLPGADALTVMVARIDADGDGRLTREETPTSWRPALDRILTVADADKNGELDARELSESAPRIGIIALAATNRLGIDVAAELAKLPAAKRRLLEDRGDYGRPGMIFADPALAAEAFERLDADGDGQLVAAELPEPLADRFAQFLRRGDRNRDGQISKKELLVIAERNAAAMRDPVDPGEYRDQVDALLNRFDRNGDGRLTIREAPRRLAENFDRADADGDGRLDREELARSAALVRRFNAEPKP